MLSKKNNGKSTIGSSSSTAGLEPTDSPSSKMIRSPIAKSTTSKHTDDKDEPTPSAVTVERSLKTEEKDSAPIFALFHGKIVPLGKLPDTSFRKSHTEALNEDKKNKHENRNEDIGKVSSHENDQVKSEILEHAKEEEEKSGPNQDVEKGKQGKTLSSSQFSRLSTYFHNLESKNKEAVETRMIKPYKKDVTGTVKDDVPELLPVTKNSELLKHVKGIILDDGKMVTLKGKQSQIEEQVNKSM